MRFPELLKNTMLFALFVVSLMSFIYFTQLNNNSKNIITEDESLNRSFIKMNETVIGFQDTAKSQKNATFFENPIVSIGNIILQSIVGVGRILSIMIITPFNIIFTLSSDLLGIPYIITGVFTAIITVLIIFMLWRSYRIGD